MPQHPHGALALGGIALALVLITAGCTSQSAVTALGGSNGSTPGSASTSPTQSAGGSGMVKVHPCILRPKAVQRAITGKWKIASRTHTTCKYRSSRGTEFGTSLVDVRHPQTGLKVAKKSCSTEPRKVRATGSFACVEKSSTGTLVVGYVTAKHHLWKLQIVPSGPAPYGLYLKAMTSLLARV